MLAGIYYGAQYGGSTTAILVNLPGESSSVVTCLDGYQMARQGRAGSALAIAALGSFFAGTVATVLIAAFAPPLTALAFKFGPAEYFSLMVLGLIGAVVLAHGSLLKAIAMIVLGLLLGIVGTDVNSGVARFAFGIPELTDGIGFVGVAHGRRSASPRSSATCESTRDARASSQQGARACGRRRSEFKRRPRRRSCAARPSARSLGVLPGGGAMLASFASYTVEKKISKTSGAHSARAPSRASPARNRPTTPARRPRSSRC